RDSLDSPTVASLGELLATKTLVAAGDKGRGEDDFRGHCRHAGHRRRAAGDQGRAGPEDHGPRGRAAEDQGRAGPDDRGRAAGPEDHGPRGRATEDQGHGQAAVHQAREVRDARGRAVV
ncbi:hypothetical protein PHYSODRAFT_284062, partial [Phytophthora sojae]